MTNHRMHDGHSQQQLHGFWLLLQMCQEDTRSIPVITNISKSLLGQFVAQQGHSYNYILLPFFHVILILTFVNNEYPLFQTQGDS